ncbi:MAG: ankyrin repeat domain-containing protein [Gammaproteobacteria bacterium]|nr:ankyrin repeat domain-containing protein [Gammaproteobacteria bacterium]
MSERYDLFIAYQIGDLEKAELLILLPKLKGSRMGINDKGSDGWTPLHWASCYGHAKMAELLISESKLKGSILDIISEKDNDGWTPLQWACYNGRAEVIELLISYGADYSEIMEKLERRGMKQKREELERIVIEVGMGKVKMI